LHHSFFKKSKRFASTLPSPFSSRSRLDFFSPQQRSGLMSRIRAKNTQPELAVRQLLHAMGYRSALTAAICLAILTSFFRDMASVSSSMDASGIFTVSAKTPEFQRHGRLGGEKNSKAMPPATNATPQPYAALVGE
jgi:hypothetical protein